MNATIRQKISKLIDWLETNQDILVIDADTHATDTEHLHGSLREKYESTDDYYHGKPASAEDLIREMDMASVDMSLIWQNPATTIYGNEEDEDFDSLLAANRYIFDASGKRYK